MFHLPSNRRCCRPYLKVSLVFGSMVLGLSNVHGQMTSSLEYACARSSVVVEARIVEYELT